ncbi:MAG: DNA mismatch repair protein MutS [Bacteroidota bacterium]
MEKNPPKEQEAIKNYQNLKDSSFDFERIGLLFQHEDKSSYHQVITDRTCRDLDFDELFMVLDRTHSSIGQQYLYQVLRTIPKSEERSERFEKIISYYKSNPDFQKGMIDELENLSDQGAYFLQHLMQSGNLKKPRWFWVIPMLSGMSIATLVLLFFFPVLPVFILLVAINIMFHYWNKTNVMTYSNSIPQLIKLRNVSLFLHEHQEVLEDKIVFKEAFHQVDSIANSAIFFKWESKLSGEIGQIGEYFFELIKATFLLEPILIYRISESLEIHGKEIRELFHEVATIDVAISIAAFREDLPYYAIPTTSDSLDIEGMFHPMITDPVPNSIVPAEGKSVLVSGSNMSGKTTFIRTVGINGLLAQTIHTTCAKSFSLPLLKIHSAVRIMDDLFEDVSYYLEEVKVIKEMIDQCKSEDRNLFLLDELFKGTNTIERVASGKAVLSYLSQKGNMVFASTHDLELMDFLSESYEFYHFEGTVEEDQLKFDFKLKKGRWSKTNAIRILEVNGFPKEVTEDAKALADEMKKAK